MNNDFYKLILVTHRQNTPLNEYLKFIEQCISSGVTCVQLREKNADSAFKMKFAQHLKKLLMSYHIPLIINDDLDLAVQVDADGVHLGQSDICAQLARNKLGKNKLIGLSLETEQDLLKANNLNLNYVAASAVFASKHKNNLKTIWGIDGLKILSKKTKHPLIGIGGITETNLEQVIDVGAQGAAIIGALHDAQNPAQVALRLRKIIDGRNT